MGRVEIARLILEKFETQMKGDLDALAAMVEGMDLAGIPSVAHGLKGAAGAATATGVHDAAARLERACLEAALDGAVNALAELRNEVALCMAHLPQVRQALSTNPEGRSKHHEDPGRR